MERAREDIAELEGSERGGVISGYSPIHSHVQLYLVQISFIVILCSVLGQVVKKWNQPRVIAEVMAGVLLGPSAFGAIPGFTHTIFPEESMEPLTLTAHLGLILFLFIVGLELDPYLLQSNVKKASMLSLVGQGATWVLSLGVSRAMITWMDDVESSTSFVLFIGVSLSVTAFPVLSRILGENSLLNTSVGALVISAASVDEACVWCLLALVVSTVNAGSPLDAFYVFLLLVFFVVVMMTAVRWTLLRLVRCISVDDTGAPSRGVVILCLLLTLISAWVTDFIGIDAIFGAFVAGIIVPREHSLHVRIVELVQDVVSVLLLPLYFAVSGLKTDLTLLDNATSWGICALTILAACLGKIGGGAAVARVFGMTKRESLAVGVLMNTRGLVELIILNIGLDAGVLTEEVMAIMVLMALATTFMTAPLSALVYPLKYHSLPGRKRRRRVSEESRAAKGDLSRALNSIPNLGEFARERLSLMVLLTNPAGLDAVARVARLFSGNRQATKSAGIRRKDSGMATDVDELMVHTLRLMENSDRYSGDMRALERGETLNKDSLAGILQGFLGLLMIKVKSHISVGNPTDFCQDVGSLVEEHGISTVVFPWEERSTQPTTQLTRVERLMRATTQAQFVVALNCHTAALASATSAGLTLLVPFFGGDDDVAALLLALAIVERDSSAELVILSFLEPEKPPVATAATGEGGGGGGGKSGSSGDPAEENGALLNMFTSPRGEASRQTSKRASCKDNEDIESGVLRGATTIANAPSAPRPLPLPTPPEQASAAGKAAAVHPSNVPGDPVLHHRATGSGTSDSIRATESPPRRRSASSWSGRELVATAEELDRVKVTPAWSLNAALSAMTISSPTDPRDATSAAATIVRQVVAAQSTGLVLCGCAGSGQPPMVATARGANGGDGGAPRARFAAPLSGANSVHGKWPSLSRSRHGPTSLSVMTRSWHGKSRHYGGRSHASSRQVAGGGGHPAAQGMGARPASQRGGLASAIDGVVSDALAYLVGDVAGALVRSDQAPAVLAVRASATVRPVVA